MRKLFTIFLLTLVTLAGGVKLAYSAIPNPKERIDFWQRNFTELKVGDDSRVVQANQIFNRVLSAAGRRYGVMPRLFIIKENPFNVVLPVSIPDGWVVISKKVLDMCYEDNKHGADRLAFVIAHEIAHLLDDDFWHMNFFNALESLQNQASVSKNTISEIKGIFGQSAKIQAKELRADERGILFATMAGFNPRAIAFDSKSTNKRSRNRSSKDSFFHEWQKLLDVGRLSAALDETSHPSASQRSAAVLARLNQVSDQADLFKLGLIFYRAGNFELAIDAFSEFLRYFPSREVYHNLAVSHHQLAIQYYVPEGNDKLLPFRLPITADPYTRAAATITRNSSQNKMELFNHHINKAIVHYQSAMLQDKGYTLAYLNLASAYLQTGQPYKAIATLQDVKKFKEDDAQVNNIMGVGFYLASNTEKAISILQQTTKQTPGFSAPHFNLGRIAFLQNDEASAKRHWQRFVELEPSSQWSGSLAVNFKIKPSSSIHNKHRQQAIEEAVEVIKGVQIGNYLDEVPQDWGEPAVIKSYNVAGKSHRLVEYANGVTLVMDGDEIRTLVANSSFKGKSKQGIKIGSDQKLLMSSYGLPGNSIRSVQGENLLYPKNGVTFQIQEGKVVSWIIY